MQKISYSEALAQIVHEDPRYDEQAYLFIREALDYTIGRLEKPSEGPGRHVSGVELLEGIRDFALEQFGPMAFRVLSHWGVLSSEDIGEMVFNLVGKGILGKTERDSRDDFAGGYDFTEAFCDPFRSKRLSKKQATIDSSRSS